MSKETVITIRLSEEERQRISDYARRRYKTPSLVLREFINNLDRDEQFLRGEIEFNEYQRSILQKRLDEILKTQAKAQKNAEEMEMTKKRALEDTQTQNKVRSFTVPMLRAVNARFPDPSERQKNSQEILRMCIDHLAHAGVPKELVGAVVDDAAVIIGKHVIIMNPESSSNFKKEVINKSMGDNGHD